MLIVKLFISAVRTYYIRPCKGLRVAIAWSPCRAPEPRDPKSACLSPKNALLDPLEQSKSQLKCPNVHYWGIKMSRNELVGHFNWGFGVPSVGGPGDCNCRTLILQFRSVGVQRQCVILAGRCLAQV